MQQKIVAIHWHLKDSFDMHLTFWACISLKRAANEEKVRYLNCAYCSSSILLSYLHFKNLSWLCTMYVIAGNVNLIKETLLEFICFQMAALQIIELQSRAELSNCLLRAALGSDTWACTILCHKVRKEQR